MGIGIGASILGSALIGGVSSLLGGKEASEGNQAAINAEWQMFQQAREDYAPWRQAGQYALEQLIGKPATAALPATAPDGTPLINDPTRGWGYWQTTQANPPPVMPITTDSWASDIRNFWNPSTATESRQWVSAQPPAQTQGTSAVPGLLQTGPGEFVPEQDPGYKFGYQEFIEKPTLQLASATGKLRSSDMLQNLTRYASDYASTKYDNFLNRYYQKLNPFFELAKMGGGAAAGSASASTAAGGNLANLALNQGNINSGMVAGMGGSLQQGLGSYADYKILEKYYPPRATSTGGISASGSPASGSNLYNWSQFSRA